MTDRKLVAADPWNQLRAHTRARIALGRAGDSLPTDEVLRFGYAHAMARDAVHRPFDAEALCAGLQSAGFESLRVHSAAPDRATYLLRPDWGRSLDEASEAHLRAMPHKGFDLVVVVGDGLSSLAVDSHVVPLMQALRSALAPGLKMGPVVVASQARVALGDPVGELLQARLVVMLIGERPGLSSPDSLGIYLTYAPRIGRQDAERNCISNVRPEGLEYGAAARKTAWLVNEALHLGLSGVGLKDQSELVEIASADLPALPG